MAQRPTDVTLNAPPSDHVVRVRMVDTTSTLVIQAKMFLEPVMPGHERMNATNVAFLIENERLGKKAVFDLGVRKDYWNSPPALQKRFDAICTGLKVPHDVRDVLLAQGIPLESINDIIWSHPHWDHVGDTTLFPSTTNLVYGPEVSSLKPGFPANPQSNMPAELFEGRENIELSFPSDGLTIGGFPAHDFYGDGSFYLLLTAGHAKGHICGLARTTADTFILLGGDVCHFAGAMRPNARFPMPDPIPKGALDKDIVFPSPCPAAFFLDDHPQHQKESSSETVTQQRDTHNDEPEVLVASKEAKRAAPVQQQQHETQQQEPEVLIASKEAKRVAAVQQHLQQQQNPPVSTQSTLIATPYYALSRDKGTAYDTPSPAVAQSTVENLTARFDSANNVLVALAHDPALLVYLPTLNALPDRDLNDWSARGLKEKIYWDWLNETSRKGKQGREDVVVGFWRDGRKFDTARQMLDEYGAWKS